MRRGHTLLELMVAIAVLAGALTVILRLLFTVDYALAPEAAQATGLGTQAQLLEDLGRDLRVARSVTASGRTVVTRGAEPVRYYWDEGQQATIRHPSNPRGERWTYPEVWVESTPRGEIVWVRIIRDDMVLTTAYSLRNR